MSVIVGCTTAAFRAFGFVASGRATAVRIAANPDIVLNNVAVAVVRTVRQFWVAPPELHPNHAPIARVEMRLEVERHGRVAVETRTRRIREASSGFATRGRLEPTGCWAVAPRAIIHPHLHVLRAAREVLLRAALGATALGAAATVHLEPGDVHVIATCDEEHLRRLVLGVSRVRRRFVTCAAIAVDKVARVLSVFIPPRGGPGLPRLPHLRPASLLEGRQAEAPWKRRSRLTRVEPGNLSTRRHVALGRRRRRRRRRADGG